MEEDLAAQGRILRRKRILLESTYDSVVGALCDSLSAQGLRGMALRRVVHPDRAIEGTRRLVAHAEEALRRSAVALHHLVKDWVPPQADAPAIRRVVSPVVAECSTREEHDAARLFGHHDQPVGVQAFVLGTDVVGEPELLDRCDAPSGEGLDLDLADFDDGLRCRGSRVGCPFRGGTAGENSHGHHGHQDESSHGVPPMGTDERIEKSRICQ